MAAGPVNRILSVVRRDGHSSGPSITGRVLCGPDSKAFHFPLDEWSLPVILRRFKAAAEFWFEGTRSSEEAEFVDAAERL